ncbi:hypothetical protein PHYSODRAFT_500774 [Phytophthora sojae]|uniref:Uncharacterized protein n=1 Tax=Phytophthora sojae (strain P6497) TaxID=1094619 RepID=G4ZJN8_PHYSP|nr:hypothetical protein PHYSODRAFT_500774 [Phytophthora sojae]EGZ18258.1 hypothetical protein PHYSODRAFT_500774 [Phytophthora sojae]|eukprot:XP_009527316.1 hypothetical protein PHYSODRAFT_500774 [Phytophthora sojae]
MERKRLIQEGLAKRAFPPRVAYPELSNLWVPEATCRGQKPACVDIEGKQVLLYIKYQCAGSARTCFSTISPEYLHSNVEAMVHFSYILGSKSGYSKPLLDMIHDGMMSPNHLNRVRRLRLSNPDYVAPTPPTVAEYCASKAVVDTKVLTAAWMETTAMYGPLCELLMQKMSVRKVLRVDHSAKFCKKLKVWDGLGQRTSISDAKLLLLIQNEVGQIVGRRLTSDNANGVRGMVQHTFGGRVDVKQDPFHVMMRVKEKLASAAKKKWISKELMSAMYTVERRLRPPEEMEKEFRRVASLVRLVISHARRRRGRAVLTATPRRSRTEICLWRITTTQKPTLRHESSLRVS